MFCPFVPANNATSADEPGNVLRVPRTCLRVWLLVANIFGWILIIVAMYVTMFWS